MLRIDNISFSIGGRKLFDQSSATIPTGHKVGLVGRNGAGKTTLFRLIRGELPLEGGEILLPKHARISGVAQEVPSSETSLLDTVLAADTERASLLAEAESATDPHRIAELQTRLADIDAWSGEARASSILRGLGFEPEAQSLPCSAFSGGWRMRVALAGVLFASPDFLLLDEPTNYLDLEGALWLESYLRNYPHTVLIISHDRGLLNRAVQGILHLENGKLSHWQGGYDQFARQLAEQRAGQAAEARKVAARRAHLQGFVDRFRYKATKARQAQSRLKMLEKLEPITLPEQAGQVVFTFPEPEELSPPIVTLENAAVGYGGVPVLDRLSLRIDQDDRIALLGRNGEGKSTLSKLLAGKMAPQSGRIIRARNLRVGYFAQHQVDELVVTDTPIDHVRRLRPDEAPARLRARLAGFGLGAEQAAITVSQLSGGQKARLSLLLATIDAPQLLILDEPTNHLDIESREALIEALTAYSGAVILVSHDMHLLSLVADRLWLVQAGRVAPYDGDLEDYRRLLMARDDPPKRVAPPAKVKSSLPADLVALRAETRKCEERLEKLGEMRTKLAGRMADPGLYDAARAGELARLTAKFAELEEAEHKAETLWLRAQERLDAAGRG